MGCSNCTVDDRANHHFEFPKCLAAIKYDTIIRSMSFIDKDKLLLGCKSEINILNINTREITQFSTEHKNWVNVIIRLRNGLMVTGGQDKTIKVWDINKRESVATLTGHTSMIWTLSEIQNGNLISGSSDKTIRIWDMKEFKEINKIDCKEECSSVLGLKTGQILATFDKSLNLYKSEDNSLVSSLAAAYNIWCMCELTDGKIACGDGKGNILIIDISNNNLKMVNKLIGGHSKAINSLHELQSNHLLSSAEENVLVIWDLSDPESKQTIEGHAANITCLTKGVTNTFVSYAKEGIIKVWN